jgi:hypothetical protein
MLLPIPIYRQEIADISFQHSYLSIETLFDDLILKTHFNIQAEKRVAGMHKNNVGTYIPGMSIPVITSAHKKDF